VEQNQLPALAQVKQFKAITRCMIMRAADMAGGAETRVWKEEGSRGMDRGHVFSLEPNIRLGPY